MTNVWMHDGHGNKAFVPEAAADRWKPRGWAESDVPADSDKVWMEHTEHKGRALFPAGIAPTWGALGWVPSEPAEPYYLTKDPALVDVAKDAPSESVEPREANDAPADPPVEPVASTTTKTKPKTEPATAGREQKE